MALPRVETDPQTAASAAGAMRAVVYGGRREMRVERRPRPRVVEADDAVVRITTAAICGSDLHLYQMALPGLDGGIVLGHEGVGIVEDVGAHVAGVRPGDRVVVSGLVADGTCWYCRHGLYSQCETTNRNPLPRVLHGQYHGGLLGYGPLAGGWGGTQAEAVRIPYADVNLLPLPDDVPDDKAVFLSDVLTVAWQACDLGDVGPGQTVAVWGCGPVGLNVLHCARARGAERLIAVDEVPERLELAARATGAETVDFSRESPVRSILERTGGRGPDVVIEAVGFRCDRSLHHRFQRATGLETDALDTVSAMLRTVRKGGTAVVAGFFVGWGNQFPIGALMEKGVRLIGSPVYVQRYWRELLEKLESRELDPTFTITHRLPLDDAPRAYRIFDERRDGAIKILLHP